MKARAIISRLALAAGMGLAIMAVGLFGLSYFDVRASTARSHLTPVSAVPNSTHILVVRWRVGEYNPLFDMPGQYVLWTLRPFRKVYWLK
jgi:hypothetical protein